MKRIVSAVLLSALLAAPAVAADAKNHVGISYGVDLNGVVGIQGEFDISSMVNKAPVSLQVFWKNYSQYYSSPVGSYQWNYNGWGAAALYDLSSVVSLDSRFKPYAGLGLIALFSTINGADSPYTRGADSGGLYIIAGVRYATTPTLTIDLNLNNYGGLTIGTIYNF